MSNPLLVNCIFKNRRGCVSVLNSGSVLTLRKRLKLARSLMLKGICLGSLLSISNVSHKVIKTFMHFLGKLNMYILSLIITMETGIYQADSVSLCGCQRFVCCDGSFV